MPIIENTENEIFVSIVSIWELRIKQAKGRLDLPEEFEEGISRMGFSILPLTIKHIKRMTTLPPHHRDPFDRIMIAQSLVENMVFITRDEVILEYDLRALKA